MVASPGPPDRIAGGKKIPERDAIQLAWNAVRAGARGVDMGRNIFQSDAPVGMIRAVRPWCTREKSRKNSCELYQQIKERPECA